MTVSAEKAHFDLDEFFEFGQDAAAGDEEDDVVAVLDNGVGVVPHDDFTRFGTNDGGDVAVARPFDAADAPADDGGSVFVAVDDDFDGFRAAASERVDGNDVASADVGEDGADGDEVRRYDDVDFVAFEQIDVAGAVDDGNDALGTEVFRQQAGHDVVFVVVGQGAEYVDFVDVFFVQQRFVGGAALQDEGVVEVFGEPFGAAGVVFDDFDVVFGFELLGEAVADVAAAGNHDAAGARFFGAQFAHDDVDAADVGGKKYLVAFDDDGLRRGDDEAVVAVYGADLAVRAFGEVLVDVGDFAVDEQPAFTRLYDDHADFVAGKPQYLQCAGVAEQSDELFGNELFGADGFGDVEDGKAAVFRIVVFGVGVFQIFAGTHAGDAAGDIEEVGGDFAGDDVGFVAAGQGEQEVGICRARLFEDKRGCAVAEYGLDVEAAADVLQGFFVDVDNGNVVAGNGGKVLRDGRADLSAAEDEDFHGLGGWLGKDDGIV